MKELIPQGGGIDRISNFLWVNMLDMSISVVLSRAELIGES
ncbi:MAG: hypothetical protein ACOY32_02720 [Thermodesulfobacteriota bacterium]